MFEEKNQPSAGFLIGGGVLLTLILVVLFFTVASQPDTIAAPQAFKPYSAPDNSFACLAPTGWERKESAAQGIQGQVIFRKGEAKIDIASDLQGSLMGDLARATDAQSQALMEQIEQLPPELRAQLTTVNTTAPRPAIEQVHLQSKASLAMRFDDYEEMPMRSFGSPLGEARVSEWKARKDGFLSGGNFHGYRVTILGNERRVTYTCQCPEASWAKLKPSFGKVLTSLAASPNS
ncbi:MAG: hypothetical protein V4671_07600 [Armatimonadota bacterium]